MESLERLIVDLKESVERELTGLRIELRDGLAQLHGRLDEQAALLDSWAENAKRPGRRLQ